VHEGVVEGRWKKQPDRHYSRSTETALVQRYVNCGMESESILAFTRRWGPLSGNIWTGESFSFSVDGWCGSQRTMREHWSLLVQGKTVGVPYLPAGDNFIEVQGKWIEFRCGDLWTFMVLEMFTSQSKLRLCERPDCTKRYFIAQHGKERYCSTECSKWAQSQFKRRWHEQQRKKRLAATGEKGRHHGPRKTQ
jgi:hypothetical protein